MTCSLRFLLVTSLVYTFLSWCPKFCCLFDTHENHENWYSKNKIEFTVYYHVFYYFRRRHQESTDLRNYHINPGFSSSESSSRSNQLTQSSTFDETDSVTSASYDSKFSRQSSFDGYNHPMSSRSSLGTISLPGLSRSTSQDENLADSRTSSWSSLLNNNEEGHEAYATNIQYNPLLEKLFEDAESLNLLPKHNLQILCKQKDQIRNGRRDLILPDDDSEEIPFAKYTFNKKPESIESRSPSEKSSSSKESRDSFDKLSKRNKYLMSMSNDSYMSSSLTSSNFDPENMLSSYSGSQPDRKTTKQASADPWMNSVNEQMIYPATMPQGYPQQPNLSMPIPSNSIYFPQMPIQQQPPPDQMLMNLGFADDVENFLPARFAQDWKQKIIKKQQDMYVKAQQQMYYQSRPDITRRNSQLYNQYSEQVSSDSSPEQTTSTRSSYSSMSKSDKKSKVHSNNGKQNNLIVIEDRGTLTERQSSIEKLRYLLKSDSLISSVNKDNTELEMIENQEDDKKEKAMDVKRKQFARARQKSLPIYLETLNEEDECSSVKSRLMNARLQRESRSTDSSRSPSENSSFSLSSSNRDSVSEANFTDNDINEYKLTNLQGTKISQNGDKKLTKEMKNVPSICVEGGVSNESLEIDEIMGNCHNKKLDLHVEPAMVSVVLNDTDSKHKNAKNLSHLTPHFFGGDVDDKMFRRRSSSSLSVSPMPSSPVTVIEVGLDNQNDSLDNVTDSIDHDDTGHSNHIDSSFSEFSNSLEEKINRNTVILKDVPTKINNKLTESKHDVDVKNNLPTCQKKFISQVNHVSKTNSLSIEIPSIEYQDMCIQADDGSLSPIVRFTDYEYLFQKLMNVDEDNLFYLANDCGTQYEAQPDNDSLDSDKVHFFFNNSPAASSSRRHSGIIEDCSNTFHKDKEVQTCEIDRQETGIQTDTCRYVQTSDNHTSTSSYYTRCHCPRSYNMSDNVTAIQTSLQATIERLEKKTRKYSALYGKKD